MRSDSAIRPAVGEAPAAAAAPPACGPEAGLPLLIALAALGAASMNVMLPMLPAIGSAFGAGYHDVQCAFTVFLAGAALAQLGTGPLSDAHGRQPVLLLALGVFSIGSAILAIAPSVGWIGVGRLLQGFGGATALVLVEAILASALSGTLLVRRIGHLNAGVAVAVMAAPLAGAWVGSTLGWRIVACLSLVAGGTLLIACSLGMRAPAGPAPASRAAALAGTGRLLRSRRFVASTVSAGFVMANYFCLAAFGPFIGISLLGLGEVEYGFLFAALGIGYVGGSLASAPLCRTFGEDAVVTAALAGGTAVAGAGAVLFHVGRFEVAAFAAVGCIIALTAGLVLPALTSRALKVEPGAAGAAAGLLNLSIFGVGGIVTHLVGLRLSSPAAPVEAMPLMTAVALVASLVARCRRTPA